MAGEVFDGQGATAQQLALQGQGLISCELQGFAVGNGEGVGISGKGQQVGHGLAVARPLVERLRAAALEARLVGETLTLKNVAHNITCPLFIVAGKQDRIVPWQDGAKLAKAARGPTEFLLLDDGNHVANNRGYRWRTQSADWMARQLGVLKR